MNSLITIGLMNAVLASILGLVVMLVGKVVRRPAVTHALWVVVLLKLVTPPCIEIPVELQASFPLVGDWSALDSPTRPAPLSSSAPAETWPPPRALVQAAGLVWLAGALAWLGLQACRIARFYRYLDRAAPAPRELQQQTADLARGLGARRCPAVLLVPGSVSPMLWSLGLNAKLLFPADLLQRLREDSRAMLLTHELAHYRRGDHRVRLLELIVTGLYWWHPLVWWARREIEINEEECCDAWVVGQFPAVPRCYAEALLETIDFLAATKPVLPPFASGIGDVPYLRKRLTQIMQGAVPKTMSHLGRVAVLLAAVLLPLHPTLTDSAAQRDEASLSQTTERLVDLSSEDAGESLEPNAAIGETPLRFPIPAPAESGALLPGPR